MASFPQINRDRMPFPVEAIPDKILLLGGSAHFLHLVAAMTTLVFSGQGAGSGGCLLLCWLA